MKKYQLLLIFWRLDEIFNLIFIHFGLRNWLLAILYRYSFPHFFHLITVILHVWVFLWTASFAGWHKGMQNWPHGIFFVFSSLPTSDFPSVNQLKKYISLQNQEYIFLWQISGIFHFFHSRNFCLLILLCLSCILSCQWFHPPLLERKSCYLRQQMKYLENDDFSK